jgi:hypothetical protein
MGIGTVTENRSISVIRERIDADTALDIVRGVSGDDAAGLERWLCYPYHRFAATCQVPMLFGRKESALTCLVDGVNGAAATADPFAVRLTRVPADDVLRVEVSDEEAEKAARRYLLHHLGRRLRAISGFDIRLGSPERVYKTFWIGGSRNSRYMIDSVTGLTHPVR